MASVTNLPGQPSHFRSKHGHVDHIDRYATSAGPKVIEVLSLYDTEGKRTGNRNVRVGIAGKRGTFTVSFTPDDTKRLRAENGISGRGRPANGLFIVAALATKGITLAESDTDDTDADDDGESVEGDTEE